MNEGTLEKEADNKVRVALIDYRVLTRDSLSQLLSANARDFIILPFSQSSEICNFPRRGDLGLVILNIGGHMVHDNPSVCSDIRQLHENLRETPLVLFSDSDDICCVAEALAHGVRGYIPTSLDTRIVMGALRLVHAGGIFVPAGPLLQALSERSSSPAHPGMGGGEYPPANFERCTRRELEVLKFLKQGKSNKVIAYELDVEESTVKVHVHHIMRKLGATNRTQVAVLANKLPIQR